jgi:hypothetical protein
MLKNGQKMHFQESHQNGAAQKNAQKYLISVSMKLWFVIA